MKVTLTVWIKSILKLKSKSESESARAAELLFGQHGGERKIGVLKFRNLKILPLTLHFNSVSK